MRFQKGQVVKVRDDLYTMGVDGVFNLWTDMCKFAGEEVVISEARETPWGDRYEIVGSPRSWTEECFVENNLLQSKTDELNKFVKANVGDKIKLAKFNVAHIRKIQPEEILTVTRVTNGSVETDEFHFSDENEEYIIIENAPQKKPLSEYSNKEIIEELQRRYS